MAGVALPSPASNLIQKRAEGNVSVFPPYSSFQSLGIWGPSAPQSVSTTACWMQGAVGETVLSNLLELAYWRWHWHYVWCSSAFLIFALLANPGSFLQGLLKHMKQRCTWRQKHNWVEKWGRAREGEEIKNVYRSTHREKKEILKK